MKRIIRQTFLRNMVLVLIPTLIIAALFSFYSANTKRQEALDTQLNLLAHFGNETELLNTQLECIALSMSDSDEIIDPESNTPEQNIEIIRMYESSLPTGISLLYYFRRTNNIYFNNEILPYHSFEQSSYFDPALNHAGFFTELNKIGSARLLAVDPYDRRSERYSATLVSPVPVLSTSPKGSVALLIPATFFQQLSEKYFGTATPCLYVLDASHNVLYSSESLVEQQLLSQLIKSSPVGISEHSICDSDYIMLRTVSAQGMIFLSLLPANSVHGTEPGDYAALISLCAMLLILGLLAAALMTRSLYAQASHAEAEQQALRSRLAHSQAHVNLLFLDRLLSGPGSIAESNGQTQPFFEFNRFFVVICPLGELEVLDEEFLDIAAAFDSVKKKGLTLYPVHRSLQRQLVLIANLHNQSHSRESVLKLIQSVLQERLHCDPLLGCGSICDSAALIHNSFVEAQVSIDTADAAACDSFRVFEACNTEEYLNYYLDHTTMEQSIRSGNADLAINVVRSAFHSIEQVPSSAVQRCLYFDLINTLVKIAAAMEMPLQLRDISKMSLLENTDSLRMEIEHAMLNLIQAVQAQQEQTQISVKRSLVEYVQTNFRDNSLSLGQLAEEFDLSYAYVSKTFKAETGQSFLSFVTQLRFAYIKEKLKTTDIPIKDIVLESGYMDVANFMRKFRQLEGMTPGQYRQMHKS